MGKNYVHLEGNLGKDPETRQTSGGATVANASIATQYKSNDKEYTTWHRITAWGETAEALAGFGKGDKISVEGFIRYNEWTDRNGVKHKDAEIQCYSATLLFKKGSGPSSGGPSSDGPTQQSRVDDDLPF